jgi:hypothetical protein
MIRAMTTSTALIVAVVLAGPAGAQQQQQIAGAGQYCIKGATGPIRCEYQNLEQCQQARPQGDDQCVSRSVAEGTVGASPQRHPAPAPGDQKD